MEAVLRQTPRRVPTAAGEALATPAEAGLRAGRPAPSFGGRDPKGAAQGPGPAQEGGALRLVAVALPAAGPAVEPVPVARGRVTPVQGQGVPTALAVGAKGEEGPMEDPAPRPIGLATTARAATQVPASKGRQEGPSALTGPRTAAGPVGAAGAADDDRLTALLETAVRGSTSQVALVTTGLLHQDAKKRSGPQNPVSIQWCLRARCYSPSSEKNEVNIVG